MVFCAKTGFVCLINLNGPYYIVDNKIYFTRQNKEEEATEENIRHFEKSAISDVQRGKEVFIIEKFPKKFFQLATRIRIEKVVENIPSLSVKSNTRLFKIFLL